MSTEEEINLEFDIAYIAEHDQDEPDYDDLEDIKRAGWFQYEGIPDEDELFPYSYGNNMPEEEVINWNLETQIESIRLGYELRISDEFE